MTRTLTLSATTFLLAACSGSETPADPAQLMAGEWEVNMTANSFDIPGASTEQAQAARKGANIGTTQTSKYCMSEEEAKQGVHGLANSFKQGSCTDQTISVDGRDFEFSMQCRIPLFEGKAPVTMVGELGNEEFQFVMSSELSSSDFPDGTARMSMAVNGTRLGDC